MKYVSPLDRMAALVAMLMLQPASITEASAELKCDTSTVRDHLLSLHAAGLVYIMAWEKGDKGPFYPVYAFSLVGRQPNAERPYTAYAKAQEARA